MELVFVSSLLLTCRLFQAVAALQCYICEAPAHVWNLKEREAISTKYERGERFERILEGRRACLSTGGTETDCPADSKSCQFTVRIGTRNYIFTPGHGDMNELRVTSRGCGGQAGEGYIDRYPPPSVQQLASDWKTRHIDFPPGMKCKLTSKLEEESLHCVCEGDLCNEDFIPGNGQNFFNYSTQITFVCVALFSMAFIVMCVLCALRR